LRNSDVALFRFGGDFRHHRVAAGNRRCYALRLARIVNFRPDKSVEEIETIQRLRELI